MAFKYLYLILIFLLRYSTNAVPINERVMGGTNVKAGDFPFVAAIYKTTSDGNYFCTGTLLTTQWVITSGNCVEKAISFVIYLGTLHLDKPDSSSLRLSTDSYILHPEFNGETLENNLGLIKFRQPITLTNYIQPIHYLPLIRLQKATSVVSLGWGQVNDDENAPLINNYLNYGILSVLTNEECKLTYGDQITDNMLCAEGNYNQGTCSGDIGGPLIDLMHSARLNYMLVGVSNFVSYNGCASLDPSGFTRVYEYVDWIKNETQFQ